MRLFLLVTLTMIAFAANSVLNRLALADGAIGPSSFAAIRLGAGAAVLAGLLIYTKVWPTVRPKPDGAAVIGLVAYMLGFSFAYVTLDAGLGALILFGGVQITMFVGAILLGQKPNTGQWIGAAIAFAGLIWLMWPSATAPSLAGTALMALAAVGWGMYSLQGQKTDTPLAATGANFLFVLPFAIVAWLLVPAEPVSLRGVILAILSGGVTSALGYALWYQLLPRLSVATAAVAQLSVPLIAMAGGMVFLSENLTQDFVISAALVLGGILITVRSKTRAGDKSA